MPMIGADPEFFIFDDNDRPVPAHRFVPAKDDPLKLDFSTIYRDGYAVEINPRAGYCRGNLGNYVKTALQTVARRLPSGYSLRAVPAVEIDLKQLLKEAPPDVLVFGCDPAFNAYTGEYAGVDVDAASHPFRYAGGHMHVSTQAYCPEREKATAKISQSGSNPSSRNRLPWYARLDAPETQEQFLKEACQFIKMCDLFIGVPLTLFRNTREQFLRRQYYGKAGEFRIQRYPKDPDGVFYVGIEYRTPGPDMWNHQAMVSMAFGTLRELFNQYETWKGVWKPELEPYVQEAINTGKGLERLLSTVPRLYNPDFIRACAGLSEFTSLSSFMKGPECHTGWFELLAAKGIYPMSDHLNGRLPGSGISAPVLP